MGKSLKQFPQIPRYDTSDLADSAAIDRRAERLKFEEMYEQICVNPEQREIVDEITRVNALASSRMEIWLKIYRRICR